MLRRVLLTVALVAATVLAIPGSPALARACPLDWSCHWTYYSDSTHTTVVGERGADCTGTSFSWGATSTYQDYTEYAC